MGERLSDRSKIKVALDSHERPLHCHHEKTIVIDDRVAFVGGIDLTSETGDRFDSPLHHARADVGWHDVATRIEGPAVGDVATHFNLRWHEVTGEALTPPVPAEPAGEIELQIVRTIPERIYKAVPNRRLRHPRVPTRAPSVARALHATSRRPVPLVSGDRLPSSRRQDRGQPAVERRFPDPPPSALETEHRRSTTPAVSSASFLEVDAERGRIFASALLRTLGDAGRIRSTSTPKVAIVDDEWLTVGSANLNEHSLFNDTEMNVVTHDAALARQTRLRLWSEHLELPLDQVDRDPIWRSSTRSGSRSRLRPARTSKRRTGPDAPARVPPACLEAHESSFWAPFRAARGRLS